METVQLYRSLPDHYQMSSLRHLNLEMCHLKTPHPVCIFSKLSLIESKYSTINGRLPTGTYISQASKGEIQLVVRNNLSILWLTSINRYATFRVPLPFSLQDFFYYNYQTGEENATKKKTWPGKYITLPEETVTSGLKLELATSTVHMTVSHMTSLTGQYMPVSVSICLIMNN
jgi:hypothetical protein